MDLFYIITGTLSLVTGIVAGLLGRQGIARFEHNRRRR